MSSGRKFRPNGPPILYIILVGMLSSLLFLTISILANSRSDTAFFKHLAQLEGKSQAHEMILNNFRKCMQDDHEPESSCITNTILLAEVNGYKNNIAEVFHDAGIPRK